MQYFRAPIIDLEQPMTDKQRRVSLLPILGVVTAINIVDLLEDVDKEDQ